MLICRILGLTGTVEQMAKGKLPLQLRFETVELRLAELRLAVAAARALGYTNARLLYAAHYKRQGILHQL